MQMTSEEIVRDYNAAANKAKQIKILAELNCVSPSEIRVVLAEAGVKGVKMPERVRTRKTDAQGPAREPDQSDVPYHAGLSLTGGSTKGLRRFFPLYRRMLPNAPGIRLKIL